MVIKVTCIDLVKLIKDGDFPPDILYIDRRKKVNKSLINSNNQFSINFIMTQQTNINFYYYIWLMTYIFRFLTDLSAIYGGFLKASLEH